MHSRFSGPYHNLNKKLIHIVMPSVSPAFARIRNYPDGSKVRSGFEFSAAHYFSEALNFKFE